MDSSLSIRGIEGADLVEVLAINSESQPGVSHLDAGMAAALVSTASIAWVAVVGGRVAGYLIGFLPGSDYDGQEFLWFKQRRNSFIYVDQIAVASSFRSHGIGRRLYGKLVQWCADHSCPTMVCEVNMIPPNPGSLAFHKLYGFSEIGRLIVHDDREVVLLEYCTHPGQAED